MKRYAHFQPNRLAESYIMTCIQPITAWKRRYSSLTEHPIEYYRNKKIRFKDPKNNEKYEKIQIPCGHCIGCKLDHSNMWATRIALETTKHKENCFITLTYDKEHLPIQNGHMTLKKRDFQLFIKKLREHLRPQNIKISYYLAGEYGNATFRPHGHACIFGWKPNDLTQIMNSKTKNEMYTSETLKKIWGNGYIVVQELNYKTACYTARYCTKKAGLKANKRIATNEVIKDVKQDERTGKYFIIGRQKYITEKNDIYGREKEFIIMSKKPAIGLSYWKENKDKIIRNQGILLKLDGIVKKKPIPRYFKKIWEKENWQEHDTYKYHEKTLAEENHLKTLEKIDADNKEKTLLETIKYNLLQKAKLLKREQN